MIEWSKSEITSPHIPDNTETALDEEHCRPGLGAEASSTKDVDMTLQNVYDREGSRWSPRGAGHAEGFPGRGHPRAILQSYIRTMSQDEMVELPAVPRQGAYPGRCGASP